MIDRKALAKMASENEGFKGVLAEALLDLDERLTAATAEGKEKAEKPAKDVKPKAATAEGTQNPGAAVPATESAQAATGSIQPGAANGSPGSA